MQTKSKPRILAFIREAECIGCTKCIEACPVDAIVGSQQLMHTVILEECIGCKLCLPPCPVDCIDLVVKESTQKSNKEIALLAKFRIQNKKNRHQIKKSPEIQPTTSKEEYIKAAILRAKAKKINLS